MKKYHGLIIPLITPSDKNGNIDFTSLDKIIKRCIKYNSEILLLGTTGEAPSLNMKEKLDLIKYATSNYKSKTKIYVGIIETSFKNAVEIANSAFEIGVDAVFCTLPNYYPLTDQQILKYFTDFAKNVNGDVFIYNIPQTVHMSIPLDVIKKLTEIENIVGIKDSERDFERMEKLIEMCKSKPNFSYFIGWGAQCFNALQMGADGIVPSTGNISPKIYSDMIKHINEKNKKSASQLQLIADEISQIYQKDKMYCTLRLI